MKEYKQKYNTWHPAGGGQEPKRPWEPLPEIVIAGVQAGDHRVGVNWISYKTDEDGRLTSVILYGVDFSGRPPTPGYGPPVDTSL